MNACRNVSVVSTSVNISVFSAEMLAERALLPAQLQTCKLKWLMERFKEVSCSQIRSLDYNSEGRIQIWEHNLTSRASSLATSVKKRNRKCCCNLTDRNNSWEIFDRTNATEILQHPNISMEHDHNVRMKILYIHLICNMGSVYHQIYRTAAIFSSQLRLYFSH